MGITVVERNYAIVVTMQVAVVFISTIVVWEKSYEEIVNFSVVREHIPLEVAN